MFLIITAFDREAQSRNFFYWTTKLEQVFQLVNFAVATGDHLIKAELIENGRSIYLPIEAFDGQCFLKPIRELEAQWVALLSKPVQGESIQKQQFTDLARRQNERYAATIDRTKQAIELTEQHLDRVKGTFYSNEFHRSSVIQRYETLLDHYQRHLAQFETRQKASFNQLTQLKG